MKFKDPSNLRNNKQQPMTLMNIEKTAIVAMLTMISVSLISLQSKPFNLKESVERGKEVYISYCISCHLEKGEGIEGVFPPLAKSDYLMADKKRSILQTIYGVSGEIKVNGVTYNGEMTGFDLTDEEVSDVLNYVRNSFGNKGPAITPAEVKASRK
jgi:nitrite reductase (NO-forming)